jgi:hypothetical protein
MLDMRCRFPGVFFMWISLPMDKVFQLVAMSSRPKDLFDFVFKISFDVEWRRNGRALL